MLSPQETTVRLSRFWSHKQPPQLRPIAEAPRDGREILCTDGVFWRVCVPKVFSPDIWEFFRTEIGPHVHSWSMAPTHFILLEDLPQPHLGVKCGE
jgi:hypothetical protein